MTLLPSETTASKELTAVNEGRGAWQAPHPPRIMVLGIGNVLLTDEGVGVRVVESLRSWFDFSENVVLLDGGTLGLGLLDYVLEADSLLVIDAVRAGSRPATIHRLTGDDLHRVLNGSHSLHDVGLAEMLAAARLLDKRLGVVILGIEPENLSDWGTRLTDTIERRIPDLVAAALREIERMGGRHTPNSAAGAATDGTSLNPTPAALG